jgi:hypothetical protein
MGVRPGGTIPTMALENLMWGVVIVLAAFIAWSVGGLAAWIGFALVLAICASLAFALQHTR